MSVQRIAAMTVVRGQGGCEAGKRRYMLRNNTQFVV